MFFGFKPTKRFWTAAIILGVILSVLAFGTYVLLTQEQSAANTLEASLGPDSALCLAGCPSGQPNMDQLVTHHILVLANNPETKFADWVAYRITTETLGSHCARVWRRDPDILEGSTLDPVDYRGVRQIQSDRGHQAPLASLCGSPYWEEADYLSNVTPQRSDLNEGAWERLEKAERGLIYSGFATDVYSVTGPFYEEAMSGLPNARTAHKVPSGYWKVIAVKTNTGVHVAAFTFSQSSPRGLSHCAGLTSLSIVEARAQLHFFSGTDAEIKRSFERPNDILVAKLHCARTIRPYVN